MSNEIQATRVALTPRQLAEIGRYAFAEELTGSHARFAAMWQRLKYSSPDASGSIPADLGPGDLAAVATRAVAETFTAASDRPMLDVLTRWVASVSKGPDAGTEAGKTSRRRR